MDRQNQVNYLNQQLKQSTEEHLEFVIKQMDCKEHKNI